MRLNKSGLLFIERIGNNNQIIGFSLKKKKNPYTWNIIFIGLTHEFRIANVLLSFCRFTIIIFDFFFFVSWNRVAPEGYVLYITTHNEVSLLLPVCISVVSKHKPICLLSETAGWRNGRTRFLVFLLNKADGSFSCKMNALTLKAKKCKKINSPSGYDILLY